MPGAPGNPPKPLACGLRRYHSCAPTRTKISATRSLRSHRWCSNSCSRSTKSAPASPRSARCRRKASAVAKPTYSRIALSPTGPWVNRASSLACFLVRIDDSTSGTCWAIQPAAAYTGSCRSRARSSFRRDHTTSHTIRQNTGTMNRKYTPMKPSGPSTEEPFQVPCMNIAQTQPPIGAITFAQRLRDIAATPKPTPVIEVNSGCANGDITSRRMKVTTVWAKPAPSLPPSSTERPM